MAASGRCLTASFPELGEVCDLSDDGERAAWLVRLRHGRGSVVLANSGWVKARDWSTRFDMRSPRYTTRVDELPTVS